MTNLGTVLHGYCGGHFGRDHREWHCIIIAEGEDWIVTRGAIDRSYVNFKSFMNIIAKQRFITEYSQIAESCNNDDEECYKGDTP